MKILLMLLIITMFSLAEKSCKDTVNVIVQTTNLFHIVVPYLADGHGFGKNVPNMMITDTIYLIKYPKQKIYKPIHRDSLMNKLEGMEL